MKIRALAPAFLAAALLAQPALAADDGEQAFRSLFRELAETNTTLSSGDCTKAASQIAARLRAAGYPEKDVHLLVEPDHPREGSLVAILPGRDPSLKAILLLGHIDVVEAKREDWTRDPFAFIEEDGFFFGRGVADDKAQSAIFADSMIRLKSAKPLKRTVKLALTCGEETSGAFNGAQWLANNRRELIDAEFAMNEGGGGRVRPDGTPELLSMQVGEKHYQDFVLEVTNPGGHSSRPVPDNAIYHLAGALKAVEAHRFPVALNDTTRAFFLNASPMFPAPIRPHMAAISRNPGDENASAVLAMDPTLNAMLRTTCVATQVEAGHAQNALPQRARANVNCRIIPGETIEGTRAALEAVIANPKVKVSANDNRNPLATQPPLNDRILKPALALAERHFPGVPLLPMMSTGATDGPFLAAVGIPVYGVPGLLYEADGGGVHGLNERIRVKSVMDGRAYLHALLKAYADE
ncbi:M20/M25/M40 family metallo-hydrolase [Sandaracinobacteroides sp. A072]|uniref:M20/M25/M40 family metallo-hydrolase n=1 Tax=Sandaracinobacteroides sp. A072 TaxID=3461146 RepID=UPI0040430260